MCNPAMLSIMSLGTQVAGTVMSTRGAYQSAQAERDAYQYNAQVAENSARLAEWQAEDAIYRGKMDETTQRMKANQLKGSQRAALAANGVALDEGTPLALLAATDVMNEKDVATIRDNAAREAWGYRTEAANSRSEAAIMRRRASKSTSPLMAAGTALLGGLGQVASGWYSRKQVGL